MHTHTHVSTQAVPGTRRSPGPGQIASILSTPASTRLLNKMFEKVLIDREFIFAQSRGGNQRFLLCYLFVASDDRDFQLLLPAVVFFPFHCEIFVFNKFCLKTKREMNLYSHVRNKYNKQTRLFNKMLVVCFNVILF